MRKNAGRIILVTSLIMIGWAVMKGTALAWKYIQGRMAYEEVKHYVDKKQDIPPFQEQAVPEEPKEVQVLQAPISVDFQTLRQKNPEVAGWIYIESIELGYPVMQGCDNEYYLSHTWDRQEIFAASIFMDYRNSMDFSDYNTIIYGHNMKDGTMFHNIQYCMEKEYYEKSPYIWILTPTEDYRYEIFAEYDARYDSDTYTLFDGPGLELEQYISRMQRQSLWKSEVELSGNERILTLSTCNEHDLRRIVQAKRSE